jgi:hypothetical protein
VRFLERLRQRVGPLWNGDQMHVIGHHTVAKHGNIVKFHTALQEFQINHALIFCVE